MIEIDHGKGMKTRYGHNKKLLVEVGDVVSKGVTESIIISYKGKQETKENNKHYRAGNPKAHTRKQHRPTNTGLHVEHISHEIHIGKNEIHIGKVMHQSHNHQQCEASTTATPSQHEEARAEPAQGIIIID